MMRLLADENFPYLAIERLRLAGYDIVHVSIIAPGSTDEEVIALAVAERRVLLTFDKDFGELAYHRNKGLGHGVILFRLPMGAPQLRIDRVVSIMQSRSDWSGHFSVVEAARIRMRPMA